jgi:hypothetical protein
MVPAIMPADSKVRDRPNQGFKPVSVWGGGDTLFRIDLAERDGLPPVEIAVTLPRASITAFLTPDEADAAGNAYKAAAAYAR